MSPYEPDLQYRQGGGGSSFSQGGDYWFWNWLNNQPTGELPNPPSTNDNPPPNTGPGGINWGDFFDTPPDSFKENPPDWWLDFVSGGAIPGFQLMQPYDFGSIFNQLLGGNFGANTGQSRDFLNNLFANFGDFGNLNYGATPDTYINQGAIGGPTLVPGQPGLLDRIFGLRDNLGLNFGKFNKELARLGDEYTGMIGGEDLIEALLTGKGLGSGGFNFSSSGGGVPQTSIEQILAQLPEFQGRDIRTALPELSANLNRELDTVRDSQLADFERLREEQSGELLTQLFGRGVQRSTVAGDAGNRLQEGLERTRLQVLSEDIQRRLGLRKEEADRILAGDLGSLQADQAAFADRLRALTGIKTSEIAAAAQTRAAGIGASASAQGQRLAALANIFGSRSQALSSIFGNRVQGLSSGFGTQQEGLTDFANLYGNLALGNQRNEIDKMLGTAGLAFDQSRQFNQDFLDFLGFQEGVADRFQRGLLTQIGFDLEKYIAELQANTQLEIGHMGDAENWQQALSILGIFATALLSDQRIKENITDYSGPSIKPDQLKQIRPINYNYKTSYKIPEEAKQVRHGVIAQEIEKVLPEAVIENAYGILAVDYQLLVAALLKGYKEYVSLMEEVH